MFFPVDLAAVRKSGNVEYFREYCKEVHVRFYTPAFALKHEYFYSGREIKFSWVDSNKISMLTSKDCY